MKKREAEEISSNLHFDVTLGGGAHWKMLLTANDYSRSYMLTGFIIAATELDFSGSYTFSHLRNHEDVESPEQVLVELHPQNRA